jgi:hypothetical protein
LAPLRWTLHDFRILRPLQPLRRWLGSIRVVLVVQRDGEDVVHAAE